MIRHNGHLPCEIDVSYLRWLGLCEVVFRGRSCRCFWFADFTIVAALQLQKSQKEFAQLFEVVIPFMSQPVLLTVSCLAINTTADAGTTFATQPIATLVITIAVRQGHSILSSYNSMFSSAKFNFAGNSNNLHYFCRNFEKSYS